MNTELTRKILQSISNCFHPMAMLTYATLFLCLYTPIFILPLSIRLFILVEAFFYTFVLPLLAIWLMYKLKVVSHWALRDRRDRKIPLIANLLCYVACTITITYQHFIPSWGLAVFYGSTLIAIVSWIVSLWWKISGHALGVSALTTISWIYYFQFPGFVPLLIPFTLIIMTGLVCSIRVYLGRHTLAQVYTGTAVGIALMYLTFSLFL